MYAQGNQSQTQKEVCAEVAQGNGAFHDRVLEYKSFYLFRKRAIPERKCILY